MRGAVAKFDTLYPNVAPDKQIDFEGSFLFSASTSQPCFSCGAETFWIDGNLMAYLCSEECERAEWAGYFKALAS